MANQDSQTSFERRLAKYGAMSLAAASGIVATPANATVIITDASTACPYTSTTTGSLYFNIATGMCSAAGSSAGGPMFKLVKSSGTGGTLVLKMVGISSFAQLAGDGNFLNKLASSAAAFNNLPLFGGALEYSSGGTHFGNWDDTDHGFVGLVTSASGFHYGWAELTISGYDATLLRFAYDDAAGPPPGLTPEPSSMGLLALGAVGLAAYRRKKAKAV